MKIIISVVFLGETAAAVAVSGGGTAAGGIAVAKSNETSPLRQMFYLVTSLAPYFQGGLL